MSYTTKKSHQSGSEYSVIYTDMRGVDFSLDGGSISKHRFAYLENMYRDYDGVGSGMVESIPGFRRIYSLGSKINGIFPYKSASGKQKLVVHTGSNLHELDISNPDSVENNATLNGISNNKSSAFFAKDALYVLDGEKFIKISDTSKSTIKDGCADIYIPTTYYNGQEYEQRNLLTRSFYEITNAGSCESLAHATDGINYSIINTEEPECTVSGYDGSESDIYIPSRVLIGERYYSVKRIEDYAFEGKNITSCHVASGVSHIGIMAFRNCKNLTRVVLPDTVTDVGNACFIGCDSLSGLHLGFGLNRLGDNFIGNCPSLTEITYSGSNADLAKVENYSALLSLSIIYNHIITEIAISVKIHSPAIEINNITVGDEAMSFRIETKNGLCTRAVIILENKALYNGKDIKISGTLSSSPDDYKNVHRGFLGANYSGIGSVASTILECKIAESYDGRIFLTGNKRYPGICFYSTVDSTGENNPLYFGDMNYFCDGVGNFDNVALLAAGDSLAVFKSEDDGGGSIYYHTPHDTGIDLVPRIYPVSYIHSGICAKGKAISFFDDPVFVSEKGISALTKKTINLERSIAVRSTNINPKLLCENLGTLKLAVWRGYLAVLAGERMYLADSRATFEGHSGDFEYEWYYLSGLGSYINDSKVYRFASTAHKGYNVHPDTDRIAEGTVYSTYVDGDLVYYVQYGKVMYEVYKTEELMGGTFYPATDIISVAGLLILATENGDILLFNSDKRGVAPPTLTEDEDFDAEEFESIYKGRIHPYYYSFCGHAPRYALQTKNDNCSIPHLEKSTVKGSLSIKCRAVSSGKLICEVGCDNVGYSEVCSFPNSGLLFSDIDFSNLSLVTQDTYTVPIREKAKGWVEKQITLYTEEFGSPFGIYTIAYRFFIKGKIKKSR